MNMAEKRFVPRSKIECGRAGFGYQNFEKYFKNPNPAVCEGWAAHSPGPLHREKNSFRFLLKSQSDALNIGLKQLFELSV